MKCLSFLYSFTCRLQGFNKGRGFRAIASMQRVSLNRMDQCLSETHFQLIKRCWSEKCKKNIKWFTPLQCLIGTAILLLHSLRSLCYWEPSTPVKEKKHFTPSVDSLTCVLILGKMCVLGMIECLSPLLSKRQRKKDVKGSRDMKPKQRGNKEISHLMLNKPSRV